MYSSGGCSIPAAGSPSRNRFQSSVATADPRQVLGPVAAVVHVLVQRVREDQDDGAGQEVGQLTLHTEMQMTRSDEQMCDIQTLMRISYAVYIFKLIHKKSQTTHT